ncbi:hypothetical protein [Actinomadura sp. DC4]|uniref:hypothetical protein n=1 Tax=Actinomadura sp. DC4 TaxID=3055069 RepID=UPI0025AFAA80|nr:hypothetical protein [Actinomadura sp. DC4]MDN3356714.1 hypothetical protein [Actinomadura sp. DC4]
MAIRIRLRTEATTRARLGEKVLNELRTQLRPVDCQTCGRRFRRWQTPALAVYADGPVAIALIHHGRCHPAGWHDEPYRSPGGVPHLTWRAGAFTLPAEVAPALLTDDVPFFLVNPAYEAMPLHRDDDGAWRMATQDIFRASGFAHGLTTLTSTTPTPELTARIDGERISVTVGTPARHEWPNITIPPSTADLARSRGSILVGVTTLLDANGPLPLDDLLVLITLNLLAVGVAALPEPTPAT